MKKKSLIDKSPKYWLSLEQWSRDRDFQKLAGEGREFLHPLPSQKETEGLWERREFLQLMAASLALAGFGCMRRPTEKIVPYVKRPADVSLGKDNFYSSSYYDGEEGFGIVVRTREGRPVKIEGNTHHPVNQGGLSSRAHAHILSLYDPERLQDPQKNLFNEQKTNKESVRAPYPTADKDIVSQIKKGRTAFLTGEWPSPSSEKLLRDFCKNFSCAHFVWNPLNHSALAGAQKLCYGKALVPRLALDRARLIVSIDCDFLGTWLYPTGFNRMYSKGRSANRDMNRLVVFESLFSLTGANADWRVRIKPSAQLDLTLSLAYGLMQKGFVKAKWPSGLKKPSADSYKNFAVSKKDWDYLINDLWNNRGQSLILAGSAGGGQKAQALHIAVTWLNHLLKNDGYTVDYRHPYRTWTWAQRNITSLIKKLEEGKIKTLIIHRTNPLYTYPEQERLRRALKKAELVVYTGDREDETGRQAHYILPDHHDLEKWSDWEFQKGTLSIGQPTIRPLYRTRAFEEGLMAWASAMNKKAFLRGSKSWYEYVKQNVKTLRPLNFSWDGFLKSGVSVKNPEDLKIRFPARSFRAQALFALARFVKKEGERELSANRLADKNVVGGRYELLLYSTCGLKDGALANVSWLQEFPDPVTKICWDNYLCVSPADARKNNLQEGQVVQLAPPAERNVASSAKETVARTGSTATSISTSTKSQAVPADSLERVVDLSARPVKVPVHIQPGQADGVVALALGYGRERAGKIANRVGVNAWPLVKVSDKGEPVFSAWPVSITATSKKMPLANTQGHHSMEGRQIVVETTLQKYLQNPGGAIHRHKVFSLWSAHEYPKHKWGMVIDLNTCTGCSACITACQSENNIPTVGKDMVLQGREMHWIRVDRYYKGTPEEPSALHQPVVCMHCDNAPCETVCPVAATVHSDEGTNDMIYNRCVGTRYCANNCPYKVRRFNWFNYAKKVEKPLNMAMNPDVTVRSRGVMEKCTFCLHRIRGAQAQAKLENRALKDGDVQTACQQSCPTGAIVFGDLKDKSSEVYRLFHREDSYSLLEELNTKPAVRYQVKVRNEKVRNKKSKPPTKNG